MSVEFINNRATAQNDDLKRRLLENVASEKVNFLKFAEGFYAQGQRSDSSYAVFCKKIIEAVDKVLATGNVDSSLFLHNTVKPLKKIREQALELLQQIESDADMGNFTLPELDADSVKLYISIFQNDGHNLHKWELQLRSINSHLMGRPVYQFEEDARKMIRMKAMPISEAYIVVAVNNAGIQSDPHRPPRLDRNGSVLMTLKSNVILPENILEFVHLEKRYFFVKGKLYESTRTTE